MESQGISVVKLSGKKAGKHVTPRSPETIAFISGIPRFRTGHESRKKIQKLLKEYRVKKVRVEHNTDGHARGWAIVTFTCLDDFIAACDATLVHLNSLGLHMTLCDNLKICLAFPTANYNQRQLLKLDPEAYFSITSGYVAEDIAQVCLMILDSLAEPRRSYRIVDCTGGGGGNAYSFWRSQRCHELVCIEIDPCRIKDLEHNLRILNCCSYDNTSPLPSLGDDNHRPRESPALAGGSCVKVIQSDCMEWLRARKSFEEFDSFDVVFIDPPWGGQTYMEVIKATGVEPYDYAISKDGETVADLLCGFSRSCSSGGSHPYAGRVKVAAVKVPTVFDAQHFFRRITLTDKIESDRETLKDDQQPQQHSEFLATLTNTYTSSRSPSMSTSCVDERPHPFRLQLDTRTSLLLVAYPPHAQNADLDRIVATLQRFNLLCGEEYHPRYFDWEKQTFVSVRRWRGYTGKPAAAVFSTTKM